MAKQKKSAKSGTGRGSPEAIKKRQVARQLNSVFSATASTESKLDGRTAKRRKRLIEELKGGKGTRSLKTLDVVTHTQELLGMGETIGSLKKLGIKVRKTELDETRALAVENVQSTYKFRLDAWKLLGIQLDDSGKVVRAAAAAAPAKKKTKTTAKKKKG